MSLMNVEFYENPEPRVPVVLILDTSASMSGAPISELNQGVATFKQEVLRDSKAALRVEVAIVTFNNSAKLSQDFVTLGDFNPSHLVASGGTAMGEAIELALDTLESRKLTYNINQILYYQPWAWLITDGEPNGNSPWQSAAHKAHTLVAADKLSFFAIGCGESVPGFLTRLGKNGVKNCQNIDGISILAVQTHDPDINRLYSRTVPI